MTRTTIPRASRRRPAVADFRDCVAIDQASAEGCHCSSRYSGSTPTLAWNAPHSAAPRQGGGVAIRRDSEERALVHLDTVALAKVPLGSLEK